MVSSPSSVRLVVSGQSMRGPLRVWIRSVSRKSVRTVFGFGKELSGALYTFWLIAPVVRERRLLCSGKFHASLSYYPFRSATRQTIRQRANLLRHLISDRRAGAWRACRRQRRRQIDGSAYHRRD